MEQLGRQLRLVEILEVHQSETQIRAVRRKAAFHRLRIPGAVHQERDPNQPRDCLPVAEVEKARLRR
jgi:rhodanese-related sulfurtransferase